ncbi:MAG: trypsin-like peptidase domain-containing protein [Bacteroidales bacterium]|nr:trypsin-like peptidase domain-containing protein [Bacteroidales bacterium]
MKKLILIALVFAGCGAGAHDNAQPQAVETVVEAKAAPVEYVDFSDVAAATIDAVVHIRTEMTKVTPLYQTFFGMIIDRGVQRQKYEAYGSGVIVSADGYIVTNNHVVQDAERITVNLNNKRVVEARLVGTDPATDLAVIKIEDKDLTYIPYGNSDLARIGEPVLAIGNPFNLTSTVTAGIISAKARNMNIIANPGGQESPIESFIQTDAAVNPGNSGGALVNASGQLIGIVTAIASGDGYYTGYSFAIPSNLVKKVAKDLMEYGHVQRAYLGVNVVEVTNDVARQTGVSELKGLYVANVLPGCAAAKAGIKSGDVIRTVKGVEVNTFAELTEELGRCAPGDQVEIVFTRSGRSLKTTATLLNSQGTTSIIRKKKGGQ